MANWVTIARADEIEPGSGRNVEVGDAVVAIFNHAGSLYALEGSCPHQGGPLGDGYLDDDGVVTCPWHAWQFRVTDGVSPLSDALRARQYPVRVENGMVEVDLGTV